MTEKSESEQLPLLQSTERAIHVLRLDREIGSVLVLRSQYSESMHDLKKVTWLSCASVNPWRNRKWVRARMGQEDKQQQCVRKISQSMLDEGIDRQKTNCSIVLKSCHCRRYGKLKTLCMKKIKYLHFFFSLQLLPQLPSDTFGKGKKILNLRLRHIQNLQIFHKTGRSEQSSRLFGRWADRGGKHGESAIKVF